ncbi:hypothetical protein A7982_12109 [Minicystis rosea]|nr:hypothetical protein A7982_12109 [Minicystis rosea]
MKLYDSALAPAVGTDVPVMTILVPPKGVISSKHPNGIVFSNGIGIAATMESPDSDTSPPDAGAVIVSLFHR